MGGRRDEFRAAGTPGEQLAGSGRRILFLRRAFLIAFQQRGGRHVWVNSQSGESEFRYEEIQEAAFGSSLEVSNRAKTPFL
jgi:hypothetical protein